MFDKLVESTNVKPQGRSKFYLAITAIYGVSIMALGILTIMWFNPMPAEAYERIGMLAPPVPIAPASVTRVIQRAEAAPRNFAPISVPKDFPDPRKITSAPRVNRNPNVVIGIPGPNNDGPAPTQSDFNLGGNDSPPVPIPAVKTTPSPTPKVEADADSNTENQQTCS